MQVPLQFVVPAGQLQVQFVVFKTCPLGHELVHTHWQKLLGVRPGGQIIQRPY